MRDTWSGQERETEWRLATTPVCECCITWILSQAPAMTINILPNHKMKQWNNFISLMDYICEYYWHYQSRTTMTDILSCYYHNYSHYWAHLTMELNNMLCLLCYGCGTSDVNKILRECKANDMLCSFVSNVKGLFVISLQKTPKNN